MRKSRILPCLMMIKVKNRQRIRVRQRRIKRTSRMNSIRSRLPHKCQKRLPSFKSSSSLRIRRRNRRQQLPKNPFFLVTASKI